MGRTYQFECPYCFYRAKVSGGADSGIHCEVQTVVCRDCRALLDVFTKVRRRVGVAAVIKFPGFFRPEIPPVILYDGTDGHGLVWENYQPTCPVESKHHVETWTNPGRCPRCGTFLEKNGRPFRLWD